jgi:hypothetical protein
LDFFSIGYMCVPGCLGDLYRLWDGVAGIHPLQT